MRTDEGMRIITKKRLEEFARRHPDALDALQAWHDEAARAQWHNLTDVRRTYPHADGARMASGRNATVFNIRRNRYRLIAAVHYDAGKIFVMRFLTHAQYTRGKWKGIL
jgi:mRNA interferase HigB